MRNLYLTGFMGTGKSSVGRLVSERLGMSYSDLDALISALAGCSVADVFSNYGESHFRDLERMAVRTVAGRYGVVVATGGGAVLAKENRDVFRLSGLVVNLTATPEEIYERLRDDTSRPLLAADCSIEAISRMVGVREPFYREADMRIDTSGKKVEDVAEEIISAVRGCM